jgi:hypothetical protein
MFSASTQSSYIETAPDQEQTSTVSKVAGW